MRIAFRTDASLQIGTGHIMRCLTLADALFERGAQSTFICRPHAGHLIDMIRQLGHAAIALAPADDPFTAPADPSHAKWLGTDWSSDAEQTRQAIGNQVVDLLVVALESGMGLDAAITRVSKELARSHALLAEEFYLAGLEVRAGAGRMTALKNLALRMNLDDLNGLVTMLNQSERFGTSLGEALRVQSEVMRLKRGQRAEEIAAKIPVKMLFPLIFFIFPSIMVVLIGPGWMQISAAFGFK